MAKITLVILGKSGIGKKIRGDSIGCQYSWDTHNTKMISMLDKEEWFVNKFKLLGKDVYKELNSLNKPIIVKKEWKKLKNQIVFPVDKIIEEFGIKYFTCSQAYLIAYALYLGYKEIELVGFDNKMDSLEEIKKDVEWQNVLWD